MAGEERILVSVRLRPVNAREAERGDGSDWECAGPTTLMFRGNIPERAMFPATYTYGEPTIPPRCLHVLGEVARSNSLSILRAFQTGCSTRSATPGRCTRKGPSRWPCRCSAASTVRAHMHQLQYCCSSNTTSMITTLKLHTAQQVYLRTGRRAAGRRTRWSASRSSACRTSTTTLTRSSGFFFFFLHRLQIHR